MTTKMLNVCAMIAMAVAGSQSVLLAQGKHSMEGTWDVSVTVVNCQSGGVRSLIGSWVNGLRPRRMDISD